MVKAITGRYERWIRAREEELCFRATNRVVRDFEWGLEWTHKWPCAERHPKNGEAPEDYVAKLNQLLADSITLRDMYKKHHWQVSGPTFYQLHLLFDKHFDEQVEMVDTIAERVQLLGGQMEMIVEEATKIGRSVGRVSNHFHTVAGGNDHALFNSGVSAEIAATIGQARVRNRQALPHFERGALVVHADQLVSHAANLWMVEK